MRFRVTSVTMRSGSSEPVYVLGVDDDPLDAAEQPRALRRARTSTT